MRRSTMQRDRRGAMLPLIAVLLPVLIVFVGFAVDLSHMQNTRLEMRVATDSAARAAASKLSATDSTSQALAEAQRIAGLNPVAGVPLQLTSSDVVFGRSQKNGADQWVFTAGGIPENSVRIASRRTAGSPDGGVPLFFGSFLGRSYFEPTQSSTASFLNIDICLVLDRSSSMKLRVDDPSQGMSSSDARFCQVPRPDSRWAALDAAVRIFLTELNGTRGIEQVALATYAGEISSSYCGASPIPATLDSPLSTNLAVVETSLDGLATNVWNGMTYIEAGMRVGLDELTNSPSVRQNAQKIMIVFTDGHENEGNSLLSAQDCANAEITIHTVTLGDFADQDRMRNVSSLGAGRHLHADDEAGLAAAFRELAAQIAQLTE
ncbi:MAG: VWA domain-containing protein [Aeoliella sp.]